MSFQDPSHTAGVARTRRGTGREGVGLVLLQHRMMLRRARGTGGKGMGLVL